MNLEEKIEHLATLISRYGFAYPHNSDELDIMTRLENSDNAIKRLEEKLARLETQATRNE